MRVVQTFWTKPYSNDNPQRQLRRSNLCWSDRFAGLTAFCLSTHLLRQHYGSVTLYTDDDGAEMVDSLKIPYKAVDTGLNALKHSPASWWALAKMMTHELIRDGDDTGAYMLVDWDVFLTKPLPRKFFEHPVSVQNFEDLNTGRISGLYKDGLHHLLRRLSQKDLPSFMDGPADLFAFNQSINIGVFYTRLTATIARFAEAMHEFILSDKVIEFDHPCRGMLMDQYFLAAHLRKKQVKVGSLIQGEPSDAKATRLGYVHFLGEAKWNPIETHKFLAWAHREYPRVVKQAERMV